MFLLVIVRGVLCHYPTVFRGGEGRVRVDIPDKTVPDHKPYRVVHDPVVEVSIDAWDSSGDTHDSYLHKIALEFSEKSDLCWRDLRPPINGLTES